MENYADIKISYEFAVSHSDLSWKDIKFGIDYGYLKSDHAIAHAVNELAEILNEQQSPLSDLEGLAFLLRGEDVEPFLTNLSKFDDKELEVVKEKWLYLVLKWVYLHKDSLYSDPLDLIELIYSDFDYPCSISNLVRYMPKENASKYTSSGEQLIFDMWLDYLKSQE